MRRTSQTGKGSPKQCSSSSTTFVKIQNHTSSLSRIKETLSSAISSIWTTTENSSPCKANSPGTKRSPSSAPKPHSLRSAECNAWTAQPATSSATWSTLARTPSHLIKTPQAGRLRTGLANPVWFIREGRISRLGPSRPGRWYCSWWLMIMCRAGGIGRISSGITRRWVLLRDIARNTERSQCMIFCSESSCNIRLQIAKTTYL